MAGRVGPRRKGDLKDAFSMLRQLKVRFLWMSICTTFLFACCGVPLWLVWPWPFSDTLHVITLKIDESRSIRITANVDWEFMQSVYYEILRDGIPQHQPRFFGLTEAPARAIDWELIQTPDQDLVGILERSNPGIVRMFCEFSTGTRWPGEGNAPWDEYYRHIDSVLDKLRTHHPDRRLMLGDKVPGGLILGPK
jgi:hypothetical protein